MVRSQRLQAKTKTDPQSLLLDEQEQEEVIKDLHRRASCYINRLECSVAAMCAIFALVASLYSIFTFIEISFLQYSKLPESCLMYLAVSGLFSAYVHVLSGNVSIGLDSSTSIFLVLAQPVFLVKRFLHRFLVEKRKDEHTHMILNSTIQQRESSVQILVGILSILPAVFLYYIFTVRCSTAPRLIPAIIAGSNLFSAICAVYARQEVFSTVAMLHDLDGSKYHYKSL